MSKQSKFISHIGPLAQKGMVKNNILASLTIAQAILESNWGESGLTKAANNLFGIKGKYKNQGHISRTFEYYGGKRVVIDAEFRKYPSWQESIDDHNEFIRTVKIGKRSRYAKVIGEKDYKLAAKYIQEAGYATAPTYATALIKIIEDFNLNSYDVIEVTEKYLIWVGHFSLKEAAISAGDKIKSELDCYNEIKNDPKNGQYFLEVKHFTDKSKATDVKNAITLNYKLYCEVRSV